MKKKTITKTKKNSFIFLQLNFKNFDSNYSKTNLTRVKQSFYALNLANVRL